MLQWVKALPMPTQRHESDSGTPQSKESSVERGPPKAALLTHTCVLWHERCYVHAYTIYNKKLKVEDATHG